MAVPEKRRSRGAIYKHKQYSGHYQGTFINPRGNRRYMLIPYAKNGNTAKSHMFDSPQAAKKLGWVKI
jgi:hypothetical protein